MAVSAGAQAYLGARTVRPLGDMMIDGVPRGARCADARSFEAVQRVVLAAVPIRERAARHQGIGGQERVDGHGHGNGGLCDRREGVVAQGAQPMVAASGELAGDRQRGTLLTDPAGDLLVVDVIG